jgi:predicted Zn-dependent protease
MKQRFFDLVDQLKADLQGGEVLLASLSGERSDFVRFNKSLIRQAGSVAQDYLSLEIIRGQRHARGTLSIAGGEDDLPQARRAIGELRASLDHLPDDPHLLYSTEVHDTEQVGADELPDSSAVVDAVLAAGKGRDLVGIHAQGPVYEGFANSLGQRNWFSRHSFQLDWSFYLRADKAVKCNYAGFRWEQGEFERKVDWACRQLEVLDRPAKTIAPGGYRAYLAPSALREYLEMIAYAGFGLKAQRTKTTPLLKMAEAGATLSPAVTITENTGEGIAPNFQSAGFVRPASVRLIEKGRLAQPLVGPRSAKEYSVNANGASSSEMPESLDLAAGDVPLAEVPARLGEGVYVNSLWYLNYSDRPAGRVTGMTRFATFWVEGGRIAAPLNVMRFDETVYRLLGEKLEGLTRERDFLASTSTYSGRSTASVRLPGALLSEFAMTL